jgi:hypothetical protein
MYFRVRFPARLATMAERIPVISSVKVTRDPLRFGLIEWPAVTVTPGLLDTHTNFSLSENSLMRQMTGRKFGWMIRIRLSSPIGPSSKGSIREIDLVQSGQCLTSIRTAQIRSTGAAITNAVSKCLMSVFRNPALAFRPRHQYAALFPLANDIRLSTFDSRFCRPSIPARW